MLVVVAVLFSQLLSIVSGKVNYTAYGKDYSCYHAYSWKENRNKNYSSAFSVYTDILTSNYIVDGSAYTSVALSNHHSKKLLRRELQGGPPPGGGGGGGGGGGAPPSGGGGGTGGGGGGGGTGGGGGSASSTLTTGWKVTYKGIPSYNHVFTSSEVSELNNRPKASTDFPNNNGQTTASAGDYVKFGDNIGYSTTSCSKGYWPPGPVCPSGYNSSYTFPIEPAKESNSNGCYTGGKMGIMVNGVEAWSWTDANSYNSENVWYQIALKLELYDLDVCLGHAAQGLYHHHSDSPCLRQQLNDTGDSHSPIYGFAFDGFPIFGPYQAKDTLAVSCWQARDYSTVNSPTGCGANNLNKRTCLLRDEFNYTKGTTTTSKPGPNVNTTVTSMSGNTISAASGIYYQDYFYNWTCHAQSSAENRYKYLNQYNGHDHDGLGFHYHVTIDATTKLGTFPYYVGPKYYGCLQGSSESCFSAPFGSGTSSTSTSQCGSKDVTSTPQCRSYSFDAGVTTNSGTGGGSGSGGGSSGGSSSNDDDDSSDGLSIGAIIGISVAGGVVGGGILVALTVYFLSKPATHAVAVATSK